MEEVIFEGEHLLIGNLGKISVYLAFAAALFSFIAYVFATNNRQNEEGGFWKSLGRTGFFIHGFSVISIFVLLFFIIQKHYFEYQYAWQHSSTELPLKYMISCFWEGQEGSFLLWMVWHVVLGSILIFTAKKWESPVLAVVALAQIMLSSMLLGLEVGDIRLGSSPFNLLRDTMQAPIFSRPDYLHFIQDGNGLNPLLQNYWMVIHPPTLFLGFAASIVPFAYGCAALWTKDHTGWIRPALPWTLFGVMVLGTGIIMGGFWAYESLSFGGYWAWDPVENASLIPWLFLIALVHTMLIYLKSGKALYTTFLLAIFSFLLVLYATFLTRSGVLGDTSVHSFTDLGMSGQLLIFLFLFIWLPGVLSSEKPWLKYGIAVLGLIALVVNIVFGYQHLFTLVAGSLIFLSLFRSVYVSVPVMKDSSEDELSSREFWMFIGALVFVLSCFQVLIFTSVPVGNKLFGLDKAPPTDPVDFYNRWQLPFALIVGLMMAFAQLLKYKKTPLNALRSNLIIMFSAAFVLTLVFIFIFELTNPLHIALLFAAMAAVSGNMLYIIKVIKGKIKLAGAAVAHIGFGLMLAGVIASGAGKEVISLNRTAIDFGEQFNEQAKRENILLWRGVPTAMGDYEVTYIGDTTEAPNTYYKVHYVKVDRETGEYLDEEFILMPNAQINPEMGLVSNPDTRHYLTHDVFTHVTQVPDKEGTKKAPFANFKKHEILLGDTIITNNARAVLVSVVPVDDKSKYQLPDADHVLVARIKVLTLTDTLWAEPVFAIKDDMFTVFEDDLHEAGLRFKMTDIKTNSADFSQTRFLLETGEKPPVQDYIILKAYVFPYINFLWGGTIIMVIGFALSILQRIKENRRKSALPA